MRYCEFEGGSILYVHLRHEQPLFLSFSSKRRYDDHKIAATLL